MMEEKTYKIKIKFKSGEEIEVQGDQNFVKKELLELIGLLNECCKDSNKDIKFENRDSKEKSLIDYNKILDNQPVEDSDKIPYDSFVEFYKAFDPQTEQEKSLIAVFWLNKKLGKEKVRAKDVSELLDLAHISLPSNIARDLRVLASGDKAYLVSSRKGKLYEYEITRTGEIYIIRKLKERLEGESGND